MNKCFALVSEYRAESKVCMSCPDRAECSKAVVEKIAAIRGTLPEEIRSFVAEHDELIFQSNHALYGSSIGEMIVSKLNASLSEVKKSLKSGENLVESKNKPLRAVIDLLLNETHVTNEMIRQAVGENNAACIVVMWLTKKKFIRLNGMNQELIV